MTGGRSSSSGPKYLQLARQVRKKIEEGIYEAGQPIPLYEDPTLELPKASSAIERALRLLAEEGWVIADRDGVFRASKPKEVSGVLLGWDPSNTAPYGFFEADLRVLSKVAATLPSEFLEHFEVHGVDGRRASKIVKVYLENDRPLVLETIIAPTSCLAGLVMKDHRHDNIYKIIEVGYQARIARITQRVRVRTATEEEAMALQIGRNSHILAVDRILFGGRSAVAVIRLAYPDLDRGFIEEARSPLGTAGISR